MRELLICGWVLAGLAGCDRSGVESRRVAKGIERVPEEWAGSPGGSADGESFEAEGAWPWTVPDGWAEDPEPRPMRLATYVVVSGGVRVEVAVTRFGGRVGGELANINRWRGQMGLAPIGASALDSAIERFSSTGYEGYQARIESPSGVMLAAGVYEQAKDQTWFVRATAVDGEAAELVEAGVFGMARSIAGVENGSGG